MSKRDGFVFTAVKKISFIFFVLFSFVMITNCDGAVGLGESVDTKSPTLEISYPPIASVIRDKFVLAGKWSDDKGVASISVKVINTLTKDVVDTLSATVNDNKTWNVELNPFDENTGKYKYLDGTYQVSIEAKDAAGHSSGEASRTFDIDNTPPVFIISNPGVVASSDLSASAYGSVFTIEGTIADDHSIETMDVAIYDENGTLVSKETYNSEQIDCFREEDISTAGGTSVTIAQYSSTSNNRYSDIYGANTSAGTKNYYCSISLSDSSKIYNNPPILSTSSDNSSNNSVVEDSSSPSGNLTSNVYLYDDVYTSLMSTKKGLGLSASDLKDILSGKTTNEDALSILTSSVKDTSASQDNRLFFSLNPEANPTYQVNGYAFDFSSSPTIQSASSGNTISITVSSGLDGTNIEPSCVKLWMKKYDSIPTDEDSVKTEISSLVGKVSVNEKNDSFEFNEINTTFDTNTVSTESSDDDWILIYDYSKHNDKGSSVSTKTFSVTLPEGLINLNKYYILAVTGVDVEDVVFSQKTVYGFEGNEAGVAPTLKINSPDNLSYKNSSDFVFEGTATVSSNSLYVKKLRAALSVTNESSSASSNVFDGKYYVEDFECDSSKTWKLSEAYTCTGFDSSENPLNKTAVTGSSALDVDSNGNWTFNPSKLSAYSEIEAVKDSSKAYLYTLSLYSKSSSGHSISLTSNVHIDTTAPIASITSITPTVEGSDYYSSSNTKIYANGYVSVKGNVEELNLETVKYDVRLGKADEGLTDEHSIFNSKNIKLLTALNQIYRSSVPEAEQENVSFDGTIGKVFSINQTFPTELVTAAYVATYPEQGTDPEIQIEVIVTAIDVVGNSASYSTKTLNGGKNYVIKQETDKPKISFGNASENVDSADKVNIDTNLFGTTNNNKVSISFTDDDSLSQYEISIFDENGNLLDASKTSYSQNPYVVSDINKTTASCSYTLPKTEGIYQLQVTAKDTGFTGTDLSSSANVYKYKASNKFFVAVDSGAPTIDITSPVNNSWQTRNIEASGTVSKSGVTVKTEFVNSASANASVTTVENATTTVAENTSSTYSNSVKLSGNSFVGKISYPKGTSGQKFVRYTATDSYGQTSSVIKTFSVDEEAPTIKEVADCNVNLDESPYASISTYVNDNMEISKVYYALTDSKTAPTFDSSLTGWTELNLGEDKTIDGVTYKGYVATVNLKNTVTSDSTKYIFIAAKDNAGNLAVSSNYGTVKIDATLPVISVKTSDDSKSISSDEDIQTTSASYSFNVYVTDSNVDSLTSSVGTVGTAESVSNGKKYVVSLSSIADNDTKEIKLTAKDSNGRESKSFNFSISRDSTAPVITVNSYTSNIKSSALELSGTVTDTHFSTSSEYCKVLLVPNDTTQATKEASVVISKTSDNKYNWTANFNSLSDLKYNVAIISHDTFGNYSAYSTNENYVAKEPNNNSISVTKLTTGIIDVDSKAPTSSVYLSSDSSMKVLDKSKSDVSGTSSFSLKFGETFYTNKAFTLGGVIDETNLDVTDSNKPKLTVSINGATSKSLTFTRNEDNSWSYTPNTTDGTLENTSYDYTLFLKDNAGNTFEETVTVVLDTEKPTITFTSPSEGESFESTPSAKVAYSDDGVGIKAINIVVKDITDTEKTLTSGNDYSFTQGSATGSLSFVNTDAHPMSEGTFTIEVSASDYLGFNSDSSSDTTRTIYFDKSKPTVTETNVGNSTLTTNAGEITLSGTVSDTNALASSDVVVISSTVNGTEKTWSATVTKSDKKNATWSYTFVTDKKDGVDKTASNYLPDGNYTFAIVAKDVANKTTQISRSVNIDTKAPSFGNGTYSDSNKTNVKPYVTTDSVTVGDAVWYKTADLRIFGTASDENGTGIASVSYKTSEDGTNWSDSVDMAGTTSFNGTVSGINSGKTRVKIIAKDNAGNEATFAEILGPWNIDTTKPTLTDGSVKVGFASDTTASSSTFLANGNKDIYLDFEVSDEENGSGIGRIYVVSDLNASLTDSDKASYDSSTKKCTFTISQAKITKSGAMYARIYDGAGNSNDVNLFTINFDNTIPTVKLNNPTDADTLTDDIDVNGTISLSGTANDNNTLSKIEKIQYVKSDSEPTSTTTWSDLADVTISGTYNFSVTGFDTTNLTDGNYYLRAVAVDTAENTGYTEPVKVNVNQDSDRPIVKITSLSESNGSYILKQGTRSKISGSVTDDDGVEEFYMSETPFTGSEATPSTSTFSATSGSFTFSPSADSTNNKNVDGEKTVYIYVKDKEGGVFYTTAYVDASAASTANYLKNPKIKINDTDLDNSKTASEFKYFSDSLAPQIGTITGLAHKSDETVNGGLDTDSGKYDKYETVGASYILGGTERQKSIFKITANDANGIAGMSLEITYKGSDGSDKKIIRATSTTLGEDTFDESVVKGTFTGTPVNDSSDATWTTDLIDFADASTGNVTLKVVPYDNSGISGNGSVTFVVDMTGPTIKVTSPNSTEQVSGASIPVSGIATDIGGSSTDSIKWYIPTASESTKTEAGAFVTSDSTLLSSSYDSKWAGELTTTSSNSAWTFNFDGSSNTSLSEFVNNGGTVSGYYSTNDDGIVQIPVYFKSTDKLGNASINRDFVILYNPDADRPLTTITYPTTSDYKEGTTYAILGGTIRATGTVEIPDGSTSTWKVYMQISDKDGNFNATDKTKASKAKADSGYGYTVIDGDGLQTAWKADGNSSTLNYDNDSDKSKSLKSSWWGIPVTKNSTSWYYSLNANSELNPTTAGVTNDIKVRFCGVSAEGKVGRWSSAYEIHVDSNIPKYSTAMLKFASDLTSSTAFKATPTAQKEYVADMYLKGQWYAYAKITDESSVKVTEVKRGTTALTYGTDYFVYPEKAGNDGSNSAGSDIKDGSAFVAYVWVKINKNLTTTQTYTISACDSDGTPNYIHPAFEVNTDNTAPTMTALKDSYDGGKEIAMTKIKNSNKSASFSTTATDTGSGFDKLAFYFKRTVGETTTIELPTPKANGAGWEHDNSSVFAASLTDKDTELYAENNKNELYGVNLTGETSGSTFTSDSDISSYKFIRKGAIIKLSGVYYVISDVNGNAITVNETLTTSPTSAFVAAAMVLDHVSTAETPVTSGNVTTIAGDDDGDGFVEYIKKSGATWTLQADFFSDLLEDGPVSLVTVAFDKAENVTTTETPLMIANNTPRLAKVYLATDLNGNGTFTDNELGSSVNASNTNQTLNYYSALNSSGNVQDIVTISKNNDGANTGIIMRDTLGVALEFVGGVEGYGEGNGDVFYKLGVSQAKIEAPTSGTTAKITDLSSKFDKTDDSVTAGIASAKLKGLTITPAIITGGTYGTYSEYVSEKESDTPVKNVNFINLTLWDSTKGTTAGTGDTVSGGKITAFGSQYTVLNIPLYMDLVDGAKPTPEFSGLEAASATTGHVDLSDTLPSSIFTTDGGATNGLMDKDSKASGKVVFTGKVNDEKRITELNLKTSKTFANGFTTADTNVKVAEFKDGKLTATTAANSNSASWTFEITKESFTTAEGHTIEWKLTVDTSKVSGVAAADVKFTITANDGTNSETADYQVDVVPYITGIVRNGTTISKGEMNRSAIGRYPVAEGESLKVSGYNFGTSGTFTVGSNNGSGTYTATATDGLYTFTMTVPARSGEFTVTTNSISSLNNKNDNSQNNNVESYQMSGTSTKYTANDNRYLSVWNLGNYFNNTNGGAELQQPVMTADKNGNLYASWAAQSNSNIMFSYGLASSVTPIFRCYDQPATYTGIAFDKKGTSGGANVTFIPEHQGAGGSFSNYAMSSSQVVGGAGAIQITSGDISAKTVYSGQNVNVTGNPHNSLDGGLNGTNKNSTNYFNLASYDMNRRLGSFENPHSARFGNYLHNIWFDNVTEGLKYSVVDVTDSRKDKETAGGIYGWVVLDGGYTGQDRYYNYSNTASYENNNLWTSNGNQHPFTGTNSTNVASYSDVIFAAGTAAANATSITFTATVNSAPQVGDTIALLNVEAGNYAITLKTITSVNNTNSKYSQSYTVGWTGGVSHKVTNITIYENNINVVDGNNNTTAVRNINNFTTTDQSSSAGSSASIDVTSGGNPVVAYYDATNSKLKVAWGTSSAPKLASNWRRFDTGKSCSGEVSLKVDGNDNFHIMYNNEDGQMCYVFIKNNKDDTFTTGEEEIVDENGSLSYGSISVVYNGTTYVPAMTYLNKANTANAVKYAYRTKAPLNDTSKAEWDFMIIPALGSGHYAIKENQISLESSNNWSSETATVLQNQIGATGQSPTTATPKTVDSVIAYKTSSAYETAYLKKE